MPTASNVAIPYDDFVQLVGQLVHARSGFARIADPERRAYLEARQSASLYEIETVLADSLVNSGMAREAAMLSASTFVRQVAEHWTATLAGAEPANAQPA